MTKLQFEFVIKALATDEKTNILCITSITTEDNKIFEVPNEFQSVALHEEIKKTEAFKKIKNTLKKRYQTRKIWIVLNIELEDAYLDDGGNICFHDVYLEDVKNTIDTSNTDNLTKIMEKILANKKKILNKI